MIININMCIINEGKAHSKQLSTLSFPSRHMQTVSRWRVVVGGSPAASLSWCPSRGGV